MLVAAILMAFRNEAQVNLLTVGAPLVALAALVLTALLLIFDLKRPDRFFYLLTKPNFRSWLVIGGWILMLFGAAIVTWLVFGISGKRIPGLLLLLTGILAIASACYSAFLFAQAKGREVWQSPMFIMHLLFHSFLAGAATLILMNVSSDDDQFAHNGLVFFMICLPLSLLMVLAEITVPHANENTRLAVKEIVGGSLSLRFWMMCVGGGLILPMLFIVDMAWTEYAPILVFSGAVLVLLGVWCFQDLWVKAGQSVPLS